MYRTIFLALSLLAAACASRPIGGSAPEAMIPNPASKYCIERGGTREIRESALGQAGYCRLPDGSLVDEWDLFRANHPPRPDR